MKKHQSERPTPSNPLHGITFDRAEQLEIQNQANVMAALPSSARSAIVAAMRHEIVRLDQASEWATPGTESEAQRVEMLIAAAVAYKAAQEAAIIARVPAL